MEKITFNNMVELRAFCLNMAVVNLNRDALTGTLVATAKEFEKYIVGKATLPEYTNPNAHLDPYIDILSKSMQSIGERHTKDMEEWDDFLKRMGHIKPFNVEPMENKE